MNCELCGSNIRGDPQAVNLDGGLFRVCNSCARLGTPARLPRPAYSIGLKSKKSSSIASEPKRTTPGSSPRKSPVPSFDLDADQELILRGDYSKIIKEARESLGLSQEDLGRKINEKHTVISHLEVGSLKPSDMLAKKIEHFLKIQLFVPLEDEEGPK